jgi:hypothetical protein
VLERRGSDGAIRGDGVRRSGREWQLVSSYGPLDKLRDEGD